MKISHIHPTSKSVVSTLTNVDPNRDRVEKSELILFIGMPKRMQMNIKMMMQMLVPIQTSRTVYVVGR